MTPPGFRPAADHERPPEPDDLALPVAGRKLLTGPDEQPLRIGALPGDLAWPPGTRSRRTELTEARWFPADALPPAYSPPCPAG
ncbi:hypothetical protein O7622_08535 [Micromonospora sp. WMMD1076]|uniref:hypothetical protein n=1 Tax=Micromonospora sp. WMMD1076 TaxID=3016103 RepID=UPI002499B159|nr:hypothetical protein [Micromonospora sp. WMMD1076]WFF08580.1 hypothetical protein O7622_08535 [Micromonospora sp. WMMD1076]